MLSIFEREVGVPKCVFRIGLAGKLDRQDEPRASIDPDGDRGVGLQRVRGRRLKFGGVEDVVGGVARQLQVVRVVLVVLRFDLVVGDLGNDLDRVGRLRGNERERADGDQGPTRD
jgi:hypothetical protein